MYLGVDGCMPWCIRGSQRTACESRFSPSVVASKGRGSALHSKALSYGAISQAQDFGLLNRVQKDYSNFRSWAEFILCYEIARAGG